MKKILHNKFNLAIFLFLILFIACALFAPFLAASKPIMIYFEGKLYFPLFRYLLYSGYYTKNLDRFFNLAIILFPILLLGFWKKQFFYLFFGLLFAGFAYFEINPIKNPAWAQGEKPASSWEEELNMLNPYAKLNLVIDYRIMWNEQQNMLQYLVPYRKLLEKRKGKEIPLEPSILPTLWNDRKNRLDQEIERLQTENTQYAKHRIAFIQDREVWLQKAQSHIGMILMPLIRPFNWEDDRGGNQLLNDIIPWYELSRINRKDLTAALIFGTRISLVFCVNTEFIYFIIGIPFGAIAGYYGGKFDILLSRVLEVWEGMPVLFMLLTIVAITEVKSIFWIMVTIGVFGWTGFARYVRAETLRVKPLAFVQASKAIGFSEQRILFSHVLPNSLTAVLTLIPFAILAAISSESALSFLGLGEEGSCSLGVLMDEGRTNFPAESYLLWPPAIVLSLLLIAIALLNDAVRDALDPRLN